MVVKLICIVFHSRKESLAEGFMAAAHVPVHEGEEGELSDGIDDRAAETASDIDDDGTKVEGEQVGVLHQRQGALTEVITQRLGHVLGIGPAALHFMEEALEVR